MTMTMKPTSASLRPFGLLKCQNGATVAEYAIAAAIAVAAWGNVDKSPIQLVGSASASEACAHTPRGMTPRWQRPSAGRCPAKTAA
jgi:Flp pilus assembly pilin Flp